MKSKIEQALKHFESIFEDWAPAFGKVEKLAAYAYLWHPLDPNLKSKKPIGLTLQAITHGDEVGGILSLIECIQAIKTGLIKPAFSVAFALGNPAAALENRRFLKKDLNRSFASKDRDSLETQRAAELETLLKQTDYFLDLHQTIEPSTQAFFIFPYTPQGLEFAAAAQPHVPVVTHWGKSFSLDGMCTDEFVNYNGGTGITIELGQKGFDAYHTSLGFHALLGAIRYVGQKLAQEYLSAPLAAPLYTWKAIEQYEEGMNLRDGLFNFQAIVKGEVLGTRSQGSLEARESGMLLFPKYQRDPLAPRPKEIYRIIKRIEPQELGQAGVIGV